MKKDLLKGMVSMVFAMLAMSAFAQEKPTVLTAAGDTWVRSNSAGNSWGTGNALEMKNDGTNNQHFYGLMTFNIPQVEEGAQVKSATLRLVTNYKKGDSEMKLYPLTTVVTSKTTYNDVASEITSALEGEAIADFKMKGDGTRSMGDKFSAGFETAEAWTNLIDVTAAVKSLSNTPFSFFITKVMDQAGSYSNQIFSSRATDVVNTKVSPNVTFAAADLVPQLTIVYEKGTTGISEIKSSAEEGSANGKIYNLQGVQMKGNNLPAGLYVKNGKKFIVK